MAFGGESDDGFDSFKAYSQIINFIENKEHYPWADQFPRGDDDYEEALAIAICEEYEKIASDPPSNLTEDGRSHLHTFLSRLPNSRRQIEASSSLRLYYQNRGAIRFLQCFGRSEGSLRRIESASAQELMNDAFNDGAWESVQQGASSWEEEQRALVDHLSDSFKDAQANQNDSHIWYYVALYLYGAGVAVSFTGMLLPSLIPLAGLGPFLLGMGALFTARGTLIDSSTEEDAYTVEESEYEFLDAVSRLEDRKAGSRSRDDNDDDDDDDEREPEYA